jgi:hypothetical protein
MFMHFFTHDILIFVLNYDKNSSNTNVPYAIGPMHSIEFSFQTPFCNLFEFPTTIHTHQKFNNIVHIVSFLVKCSSGDNSLNVKYHLNESSFLWFYATL